MQPALRPHKPSLRHLNTPLPPCSRGLAHPSPRHLNPPRSRGPGRLAAPRRFPHGSGAPFASQAVRARERTAASRQLHHVLPQLVSDQVWLPASSPRLRCINPPFHMPTIPRGRVSPHPHRAFLRLRARSVFRGSKLFVLASYDGRLGGDQKSLCAPPWNRQGTAAEPLRNRRGTAREPLRCRLRALLALRLRFLAVQLLPGPLPPGAPSLQTPSVSSWAQSRCCSG